MRKSDLILNPYFLIGLFFLALNDFYLKWEFGNFLTGKLSDFTGLLIFPMFIAFIFPKLSKTVSFLSGLGFIIWKTPISEPFIQALNNICFININRVIDYTDLSALFILPFSHYLINYKLKDNLAKNKFIFKINKAIILLVSLFTFCATSIRREYIPEGTVYIGESYKIKMPRESVLDKIKNMGYEYKYVKDTLMGYNFGYFQIDSIALKDNNYGPFLISNFKFNLHDLSSKETTLLLYNVTLPKNKNIQKWKELRRLSRFYKRILKINIIERIK
ncbi:MAG: hypothetical protein SFY56_14295 [Bacteroidota bacterium]|nr:hypothetical protein [Bacteroidota bacterium]